MRVLFYEINEVPWRVIDSYVKKHPRSHWAELLNSAYQLTTLTKDTGELHPWTTWPSVHRGVYNTTHGISFINQALPSKWPPLWQLLTEKGIKCGIFGSLQSYPVPDNTSYDFYVPDTFSPTAQTYPHSLEAFQRFNLRQVKQDSALPSDVTFSGSLISDVWGMIKTGLKISTLFKLGMHVVKEYLNPDHKTYRSILQAVVAFDCYKKLLKTTYPQFSTFFTNHVAGMMHRYWKQTFPQDFDCQLSSPRDQFLALNIEKAMTIADQQIGFLRKYAKTHQATLFILSSMGQEAIQREDYQGEYRIENFERFYQTLGYSRPIQNLLAMQPDFVFAFENLEDLKNFKEKVSKLTDTQKVPLFRMKEQGTTLNLNLCPSLLALTTAQICHENQLLSPQALGFKELKRDPGTGYHQPRGICLITGEGIKPQDERREVESIQILPTVLKMFGISKKNYMADPIEF